MPIKNCVFILALFLCFLLACQSSPNQAQKTAEPKQATKNPAGLKPVFSPSEVLLNFNSFWGYYTRYIKLYDDFVACEANGEVIGREDFLQQLFTGKYFPLVLAADDPKPYYRLEAIPANADSNIGLYMTQFAADELKYAKMKGKPIPAFNFRDINGKLYTSANTKGKIVLFKCWFIGCVACVEEMPALNELVKKYKDRNDILFVSLALDPKPELQAFLAKTRFDYATVPNQEEYLSKELKVNSYPMHFLINKEGLLVNVVGDEPAIADLLAREIAKN